MRPRAKRRGLNRNASGKATPRHGIPTSYNFHFARTFLLFGVKMGVFLGLVPEMGLAGRGKVALEVPRGRRGLKARVLFRDWSRFLSVFCIWWRFGACLLLRFLD